MYPLWAPSKQDRKRFSREEDEEEQKEIPPKRRKNNRFIHKDAVYRKALIQRDLSWLKYYLTMSDKDKAIELANRSPQWFIQWFLEDFDSNREDYESIPKLSSFSEEEIYSFEDEPWDFVEEYISLFPEDKLEKAGSFIANEYMKYDAEEAPTFLSVSYQGVVKNQWLIHFTDSPDDIQREGFTKGVDDLSTLALTTHLSEASKSSGGYNFAYNLSDYIRGKGSPANPHAQWQYGESAVMFRASGIQTYHFGDDESQVIFWGPSAKDIVALSKGYFNAYNEEYEESSEEEGWIVDSCKLRDSPVYGAEDLEDVVDWVVNNFEQYRKVLTCK